MKQPLFNIEVVTKVENEVMEVFNCKRGDFICFKDTYEKMVVVFVLFHHYKFDWHAIGRNYQMTYLYVPTVAEKMKFDYDRDSGFKSKIDLILKNIEYGIEKVVAERRSVA